MAVHASALGANYKNCECNREWAWARAIVQCYSGTSYKRRANESLGADGKAQIAFGWGREVGAQMVGVDYQAHARSMALAKQLRHIVITCNRFVLYTVLEKINCDHLQQIYTIH